MKRTVHDKAGVLMGNKAGAKIGFGLKQIEPFAGEVIHALLGLFDWERGLASLANGWLHTQTPALAYAVVRETNRSSHPRQYHE
jgi:hypothetical protein